MNNHHFDPPVGIHFGKPGKIFLVNSVEQASKCLSSEKWPSLRGSMRQLADEALLAAKTDAITVAEAREAFAHAAFEAGILAEHQKV